MTPLSAPEYLQRATLIFLLWISAATFLLILFLLAEKWFRQWTQRRREEAEKRWRPWVMAWLATGEPPELPAGRGRRPMAAVDRNAVRRTLLRMAQELEGDPLRRLGDLYDWIGGTSEDLRALRARRWGRRAEACRRLGLLMRTQARQRLLPLLKDRRLEVRYQATWALARMATPEVLPALFQAMAGFSRYLNLHVGDLVCRLGPPALDPLRKLLATDDPRQKLAATQLLGTLAEKEAVPALLCLLEEKDPEVRASACQALGRMAAAGTGAALRRMLRDPAWPVRMRSAEALGLLRDPAAIPDLLSAMADREWWVRRHSAEALARMGPAGMKALEEALDSQDRFARDAATEFLDRLGRIRQEAEALDRNPADARRAAIFLKKIVRCGATRVLEELAREHPRPAVRQRIREILGTAA